jgi:glutamate N-acetyltransferase / amino-acid N-acetyltransferase
MMSLTIKFINNSICAPLGFSSSAVASGLKKKYKLDLALILSAVPAVAAGVFTKNKIKAAPLILTKQHLKKKELQAIVVNSGNANACTGDLGKIHAKQTTSTVACGLNIPEHMVGVASTGVIGVPLPIEKIISHVQPLINTLAVDGSSAAKAILTTDTFIKEAAVSVELTNGNIIKIGGIAKGSGMIHPNMATMLGFITTDADISHEALQLALKLAVNDSFNMISVDGDCSTNDMVLIMANKLANNKPILAKNDPNWQLFYAGLLELCITLAQQIAKDGEGATKVIEAMVSGAKSEKQAIAVAKSVVSSCLVKTAIFGNDANWGRIACAVGYADNGIKPEKLKISLGVLVLFSAGIPLPFSEEKALEILQQSKVTINIDLGLGNISKTAWGCDLSYDYVKINASYRT